MTTHTSSRLINKHTHLNLSQSALQHTPAADLHRIKPLRGSWRSRGFLSDSLHLPLLLILLSCLFLKQKLRNGATDLQGWRCLYNVIKNSHITCPYYSLKNTWEISERERWEGRKSRFARCKTARKWSACKSQLCIFISVLNVTLSFITSAGDSSIPSWQESQ